MRTSHVFGLLLAAAAAVSGPSPSSAELLDRILAVVDERPLLLSSVRAVEEVRGLDRGQALKETIDERLMFQEASRLPQAQVSEEEEAAALRALVEAQPGLDERVAMADLRRLLRRQLAILKYIDFRFQPQIRITEEALREAWNEDYRGQPEGPPFEEAMPELRARLERRELDQRIENWVRDLRGRADVRYVEGPGSPPPPATAGP
mgnify:CR=1 FL=1|jgi:hypothetical protein